MDWSLSVIRIAVWGVGYSVGRRDGREVNNAGVWGDRRRRLLAAMRRPGGTSHARNTGGGCGAGERSDGSCYYRRRCAGRCRSGGEATAAPAGRTHVGGWVASRQPEGPYASWARSARHLEAEGAADAT